MKAILLAYSICVLCVLLAALSFGQTSESREISVKLQGHVKPVSGAVQEPLRLTIAGEPYLLSVDSSGRFSTVISGGFDLKRPEWAVLEYRATNAHDHETISFKRYFPLDTNAIFIDIHGPSSEVTVSGGYENRVHDRFLRTEREYAAQLGQDRLTRRVTDSLDTEKYRKKLKLINRYNDSYIAFQELALMFRPSAFSLRNDTRDAITNLDTLRFSQAERDALLVEYSNYVESLGRELDDGIFPDLVPDATYGTESYDALWDRYSYLLVDAWAIWCGPCIQQHPILVKLAHQNRENPAFAIVGIAISSAKEGWDNYLSKSQLNYANFWLDGEHAQPLTRKLDIVSIPRYLLVRTSDRVIVEKDIRFGDIDGVLKKYKLDK